MLSVYFIYYIEKRVKYVMRNRVIKKKKKGKDKEKEISYLADD